VQFSHREFEYFLGQLRGFRFFGVQLGPGVVRFHPVRICPALPAAARAEGIRDDAAAPAEDRLE
jgi:hypothetical protein